MLSPRLVEVLRRYYRAVRPQGDYLFPSWKKNHHLCTTSLQLACREATLRAGIRKWGQEGVRVTHVIEILDEAYPIPSKEGVSEDGSA